MSYWMYPSPVTSLGQPDDFRSSCLGLPLSLPYEVETLEEMDDRLEYICCKLAECVKARDWNTGFKNWDSALNL
jgi:proteasome activator subunit 4